MMHHTVKRNAKWAAVLAGFALTACDGGVIAPTDELDLAVNESASMVVADAVIRDLGQMNFGAMQFGGDFQPASSMTSTMTRAVTFYDADGVEQDSPDSLTTASVNIYVTSAGTAERNGWTADFARERDLTVSGLEGIETTRIWNGTGSASVSRSSHTDEFGTRTFDMTMDMVMDQVTRGVPRAENPWPLSGTITRNVLVEIVNGPNGDETREVTVVVTFNGTQYATMTANGEEFELDLAARPRERAHRRP